VLVCAYVYQYDVSVDSASIHFTRLFPYVVLVPRKQALDIVNAIGTTTTLPAGEGELSATSCLKLHVYQHM